jgi:hypothetical protein
MSAGPGIRPLRVDDLERIAELFISTFRAGGHASRSAVVDYMRAVYLDGPTFDPEVPSLVAENADGRVGAFIGVTCASFAAGDRPLRAAISTNFMVEPGSGPLVATRLVSALLAGKQDLSLTDTATDTSARIWEHCGGTRCPAYSLTFTRALRPAGHAAHRFARRDRVVGAAAAARVAARPLDFVLSRLPLEPFRMPQAGARTSALDLPSVASSLGRISRLPLCPSYDPAWLGFVLEQAARRRVGRLAGRRVEGTRSSPLGWYLYYASPGSVAEVLQLVARQQDFGAVFDTLLADALDAGAVAVSGRAHPSQLRVLTERRCGLACDMWMLVHTRDPEVEQAFRNGEALVTGLDTERWMRFIGDPFED